MERTGESHETVIRMRSIPRKYHNMLETKHFLNHPIQNAGVVHGTEMRPSMGYEILVMNQGRTLSRSYNLKRKAVVSIPIDM